MEPAWSARAVFLLSPPGPFFSAWPARLARFFPPGPPAWSRLKRSPLCPARLARFFSPGPARLVLPKSESALTRLKRSPVWPEFTSGYHTPPKAESGLVRVYLWLPHPA